MSGTQQPQQPNPQMQNLAMFAGAGQPQMSPYQTAMAALNMANNGGLSAMPQGLHPNTVALLHAIFGQPNMMASQAPAVQNPYPNGAPNVPKPAAPAPAPAPALAPNFTPGQPLSDGSQLVNAVAPSGGMFGPGGQWYNAGASIPGFYRDTATGPVQYIQPDPRAAGGYADGAGG